MQNIFELESGDYNNNNNNNNNNDDDDDDDNDDFALNINEL